MMHPTISEALATSRQQQFRREAEQWRLAWSRAGSVRARPGRPAAAVTGVAAGLAARVRQPPPRRPAAGPAQGRLIRMPQGGNAPSPRTGNFMPAGPWRRLSPPRSSISLPAPNWGVPALPSDGAGLAGAQPRWDAHRPVDTPPAPGRDTARAVRISDVVVFPGARYDDVPASAAVPAGRGTRPCGRAHLGQPSRAGLEPAVQPSRAI
jgi:hypothetical protein